MQCTKKRKKITAVNGREYGFNVLGSSFIPKLYVRCYVPKLGFLRPFWAFVCTQTIVTYVYTITVILFTLALNARQTFYLFKKQILNKQTLFPGFFQQTKVIYKNIVQIGMKLKILN